MSFPTLSDSPARVLARKQSLFTLLDQVGRELEIPPSRYKEAEARYLSVSQYLDSCPMLGRYQPRSFSQGSFRLGTTTRPLHGEEYDLDFIYHLQQAYPSYAAQEQVYQWLFQRLQGSATYAGKVEMKKRCVRIIYANEFHLDITPAVSNLTCPRKSLYVPDRKLRIWKSSHPEGYASWFEPIANLKPRLRLLEKSFSGERHIALGTAEPVPDQSAYRGILRRLVQFMKRQRDMFKEGNPDLADYAPISIIITTLAAHAYKTAIGLREYDTEFDVLATTIELMPLFIEEQTAISGRSFYAVPNPVINEENLADKWQDTKYHDVFKMWHATVQSDLLGLARLEGIDAIQESLQKSLGSTEVSRVFGAQVRNVNQARQDQKLLVSAASATSGASLITGNTFYGR